MRALSVAAFLALLVAAPAAAGAPAGFGEAPALEPAASWVAGKHVTVYCELVTTGDGGLTYIGANEITLDVRVCAALLARLAGRFPDAQAVASSLRTLAHESIHASGIGDESETECAAIRRVPGMASRFFGFKTWLSRHYLMMDVWSEHQRLPDGYRRFC